MTLPKPERLIAVLIATTTMLTLASCVAERMDDCPPDVRLFLKTDHEMGYYSSRGEGRAHDVSEWYSSMDTVAVYIFDENEMYVTVWHGGRITPGEEFEVPLRELRLKEGVYTFVAWTNRGDEYLCNLEELEARREETGQDFYLDDMRMRMTLPDEGGAIEEDLRHRHHGILERAYVSNYSILSPGPNVIALMPSLHRVNLTVTGVAPSSTGSEHTLTVTDDNRVHDFRNRYVEGHDAYRHRRQFIFTDHGGHGDNNGSGSGTRAEQAATMSASIFLMQLDDHSTTGFEIHNADAPDKPLHVEEDLVELINTVYGANRRGVDMDEVLEFDIAIDVSSKLQTVFRINGWVYIRQNFIP